MGRGDSRVDVLYALVDKKGNYSKVAGTSICSLFENTSEKVRVHVFHDGSIAGENRCNFDELAHRYGQEIIFYNVRELLPEVWREAEDIFPKAVHDKRFTEATLYRLLAPELLSREVSRVIYLDADTIVHMDIKEMWQEKIGHGGLAAVREADILGHYGLKGEGESLDIIARRMRDQGVSLATYFNAGVLMLDLVKLRNKGNLLIAGFKLLAEHPDESEFYDQSILNYYFAADLTPLPWYYNIMMNWEKEYGEPRIARGIYHYLGYHLGLDKDDQRDVLYFSYFLKTPWCNAEFFCNFFASFAQLFKGYYAPKAIEQTVAMRQLVAALASKSLVVAATEELMPRVAEMLQKPTDLVSGVHTWEINDISLPREVRVCSLGSSNNLKLELSYDVGTHMYLFFVQDYSRINALLASAGLKEGEDYLNGSSLLEDRSWLDLPVKPQIIFEKM